LAISSFKSLINWSLSSSLLLSWGVGSSCSWGVGTSESSSIGGVEFGFSSSSPSLGSLGGRVSLFLSSSKNCFLNFFSSSSLAFLIINSINFSFNSVDIPCSFLPFSSDKSVKE